MNLIQGLSLIKEGILSDDIEKIKAGYELLSGERLSEEVREDGSTDVGDDTSPTSNPTTATATASTAASPGKGVRVGVRPHASRSWFGDGSHLTSALVGCLVLVLVLRVRNVRFCQMWLAV